MEMNKAAFLDRDGTINVDKGYVYKISDFEFIENAVEGLKILQKMNFRLIVISNQSGISRGFYTEDEAKTCFNYMKEQLKNKGVIIEKYYYCPHVDEDNCKCRKPKLDLFYKAAKEFNIDFNKSIVIGDKERDLSICNVENTKGYLVNNNFSILDVANSLYNLTK